jgi:hypothetical protein
MIQFVAAIAGAIIGAFAAYMIVAFVVREVLDLGNLCGLPRCIHRATDWRDCRRNCRLASWATV